MNKPTRFYSNKQEKAVAKAIGGVKTADSGATPFSKGDVRSKCFLIECKTVTKEQSTFTVHKDWMRKNREEAFAMGKEYSAVAFDFGDGENYYILDERTFKLLNSLLEREDIQ